MRTVLNQRNAKFRFREWEEHLEAAQLQQLLSHLLLLPQAQSQQLLPVFWMNHCRRPRFKLDWQMEVAWLHTSISTKLLVTSVPSLMLQGQVTPGHINYKLSDFLLKCLVTQPKQLSKLDSQIQWLYKNSDELPKLSFRFLISVLLSGMFLSIYYYRMLFLTFVNLKLYRDSSGCCLKSKFPLRNVVRVCLPIMCRMIFSSSPVRTAAVWK